MNPPPHRYLGVMYITLTGLINSMVSSRGPWALLGKLLLYIVKLAPILKWALPEGPVGRLPVSSQDPPPQAGSLTGALKEPPLDTSNGMDPSDGNVELQVLPLN
ncbi:hypothetical protein DSO57_1026558 [Entomophthora muscae]|uniref:Uncharacterized protein n=1 Tax=Entomophthora muscae TaxID=34485 RepID=A0ACC2TD78_9FUNG|nr:hypothetical protein DSO57_1026558 [Entomophthora muscae]